MTLLPSARTTDIVVQRSGDELLVYDPKAGKAFNLNQTSALIFSHCDGKSTFDDLKLKYRNLSDEIIYFALDELKRENLISGEYQSVFTGQTRREVIKKIGLTSMIALPMIFAIIAPTAAHAASCVNPGGLAPGQNANQSACETPPGPFCGQSTYGIHCCSGSASAGPVGSCAFNAGPNAFACFCD